MRQLTMKFNVRYYLPYIPKRCRKTRYEEVSADIAFKIKSVTSKEAPIAFRLSDYHNTEEGTTEMRSYGKKLYKQYMLQGKYIEGHDEDEYKRYPMPFEYLQRIIHPYLTHSHEERNKEYVVKKYKDELDFYIIIDGNIWQSCNEPRYCIITFGLGHNHGGTGLFVKDCYNPNIPNEWYFSALDGDKAVAKANEIAQRRGDTNSVGTFEKMIEVLMPQKVKIKPLKEHGKGNDFHKQVESIVEHSESAVEAGLLTMMCALM